MIPPNADLCQNGLKQRGIKQRGHPLKVRSSFLTKLEITSESGFAEPQNAQDAKLLAPVIFMLGHTGEYMNDWGIPEWLEKEVKERDKTCVYCGIKMVEQMPPRGPRKAVATWEHIINDASIVTRENIARCCVACNASKGSKKLSDWIQSPYCKERGISQDTVAVVVKEALRAGA